MAGAVTQGRRLAEYPCDGELEPGDYCKGPPERGGGWWLKTPAGWEGRVGVTAHRVVEHEDGTITVSPSIKQEAGDGTMLWHGFLERGVWREC